MSAGYCAAAYIQWRADQFIDSEGFGANRGAGDVYQCVNGSHFVKMDFSDGNVVNFRFGCAELLKSCNGSLFGRFGQRGFTYDLANFYQPAAVMMLMRSVMFMMVLMFMIMGLRVVVSMEVLV